ncbi:putative ribonuclease H-like domain-containing protein [Tanacetum coccineum]
MSNSNINLQTQSSNALHNAIMEAGSKDRPPMLAPGNYVQWKSRIKRYIDTKPNSELIHYCLQNPPYTYQWAEKTVPVAEGSSETTTERYMENYKNVSQDIRDQLNAEAEAVQIILTGIDNDIYSTVDACPNACEMWKAIERLKQGESINVQDLETNLYWEFGKFTSRDGESLESYYSRFYKMMNELVRNQCHVTNHQVNVQFLLQLQPEWQRFVTLVKQSQELKTVSYHKLYDILKQHQNEVNEIRAERLARTANPLALVAQQQPVYHHQNHPTQNTQYSSTRSQHNDALSKKKEIDKLMALISLSFKKIYKPTNNNLRTSSNTSRANQDNTPWINKGTRHEARECQKPKRAMDAAYYKEKMLLCKQEEVGVQLNAEQADWRDDTDDEPDDQELEAHYIEHPEHPESVNDTYLEEQGAEEGPNYALMAYLSSSSDSKIVDNCKKGLGYEKYNAVPPPYTRNFMPLTPDLSFTGLDEFVNKPVVKNRKYDEEVSKGNPQMDLQYQGVIDSGCLMHMTGNMSYLTNYKEIDGGYVAFGGNPKRGKIIGKCTIKTDDYIRFTWVFFLATKDETSGILKSFITYIENLVDHKVKVIRCNNGTEFKNREMNLFCKMKGILRQFSIAKTPQQNRVAERRNMTVETKIWTQLGYNNNDQNTAE